MANDAFVVLGLSVAGIAAALELASKGQRVELYEIDDDLTLREQFVISDTSLAREPLSGQDYEDLARENLRDNGVHLMDEYRFVRLQPTSSDDGPDSNEMVIRHRAESVRKLEVNRVLFAPNGAPGSFESLIDADCKRAFGLGLSLSAWSDAPFFRAKRVAVVGKSAWGLEQAAFVARYAASVKVFADVGEFTAPPELVRAISDAAVELAESVKLTDVILSPERTISKIVYSDSHGRHEEEFEGVFLAPPIQPNWEQVAGKIASQMLVTKGALFASGIANFIDYNAYAKLFEDGVRIAREILEILSVRRA